MILFALIQQTLRELASKAAMYVLLGIATVILLLFIVGFSTSETPEGVSVKFFGMLFSPPVLADVMRGSLSMFQAALLGGLYTGIITFGVIATAGLIPDALEKGTVDLYLSKPIARWELLMGKHLGAVAAMGVVIAYFIGALYLIFGLKSGYWNHSFLGAAFLLLFSFFVLNTLVVFMGTWTRNMAIALISAFIYLFIIGGLLESRERGLYLLSGNQIYRGVVDGLYYIFPQISRVQSNIANLITHKDVEWQPFLQSLISSAAFFGAAARLVRGKDF